MVHQISNPAFSTDAGFLVAIAVLSGFSLFRSLHIFLVLFCDYPYYFSKSMDAVYGRGASFRGLSGALNDILEVFVYSCVDVLALFAEGVLVHFVHNVRCLPSSALHSIFVRYIEHQHH